MSEFIEFRDVRKVYKMGEVEIPALDGVSFQIKKGEFVVIAGASGAGKSTILNILGGMDTCTSGEIMVDGEEVSKMDARQLTTYRRYDIGFVFQFYNLVQNLTARENVELAVQICKNPLDVDQTIEAVGLRERRNNFPSQLSGGEQQRVAIARALAKKLNGQIVAIKAKAGQGGRLFGSVTSKDIAAALTQKVGEPVDKRKIVLDGDIKNFGSYEVEVKVYPKVTAKLTVKVEE